jgi:hypothetical protein
MRSAKPDEAPPAPTNKAAAVSPDVPVGDADLLQGLPVGKSGPASEADTAWQALRGAMEPPPVPEEWETNRPSREAVAEFQKKNGELAFRAAGKAKDFYTQFPNDERAEEAANRNGSFAPRFNSAIPTPRPGFERGRGA